MSELNELIATSAHHAYKAGAQAEQDRIIKLLDTAYDFYAAISNAEFKLPDGNDVLEVNDAHAAFNAYRARLLGLIKGEQK